MKVIVGISGASGVIYSVRLLEFLQTLKEIETHLIVTKAAEKIIEYELDLKIESIQKKVDFSYQENDFNAPICSGSFKIDAMIIVPCSMKTLSSIAHGISNNLLLRAADVTLKEHRKLILVPRETPLSYVHILAMETLSKSGAIILPAMPGFYHKPQNLDDIVNFIVGKLVDQMDIDNNLFTRWKGIT